MSKHKRTIMASAVLASLAASGMAQAEVGPGLLLKPWSEETQVETVNGGFTIFDNETGQEEDISIAYISSSSRMKLDKYDQPKISVGYTANSLIVDSDVAGLPGGLNNYAVAMAYDIGQVSDDWRLGYTVGMGTANDGHFQNTDSYYAMGSFAGTYMIDEQRSLVVGLTYDGNRDILPDVPLPFVQFNHYVSPQLQYMLGFYNRVNWQPNESFKLTAGSGLFPGGQIIGADVKASWLISERIETFVSFEQMTEGFYKDDRDDRRLFYRFNAAKVGVNYTLENGVNIEGGVGYAFNQSFSEGFDVRTLDKIAKPDDHALLFLNVSAAF
ncbi:hypothetical protein [Poriferisphaera corsica]|nr:hypothetical protein [Poriferisphaera corsica]